MSEMRNSSTVTAQRLDFFELPLLILSVKYLLFQSFGKAQASFESLQDQNL